MPVEAYHQMPLQDEVFVPPRNPGDFPSGSVIPNPDLDEDVDTEDDETDTEMVPEMD